MTESGCRQITFDVFGLPLRGCLWGDSGKPPVIALHGWLDNAASFSVIAPYMRDIQLLALDLAGHGQSGWRAAHASYLIWDDLKEILAVADVMQWSTFGLLGHSRGGVNAMMLASLYPERVSAVGMIEGIWPVTCTSSETPDQMRKALDKSLAHFDAKSDNSLLMMDRNKLVAKRMKSGFPVWQSTAERLIDRNLREDGDGWATDPRVAHPSEVMLNDDQVIAFLSQIKVPASLALGDQGMTSVYTTLVDRLVQFPQIRIDGFTGGHHLHMEESAVALADHFNAFFSRYCL